MSFQFVVTTYLPGKANAAASAAAAAGQTTGLAGYWLTEIGTLNQTVEIWSQPRPAPQGDAPLAQEAWTMTAVRGPAAPPAVGGIYEMRSYVLRPGMAADWIGIFTEALPAREHLSRITGLFAGEGPDADRVIHIWGYPDVNTRSSVRAAALKDPTWSGFLGKSRACQMVVRQEISIMLPAGHSPLK